MVCKQDDLSSVAIIDDSDAEGGAAAAEPAPFNISYTFDIYSLAQMKKAGKKRGDPKRSVMALKSNEPWDTFKAQTLTRIEKALKPATLGFDDYKFTFTVPRIQKTTDLEDEESYQFMVGCAVRSADPSAVICIEPLITEVSHTSAFVFIPTNFVQESDSDKENHNKDKNSGDSGSESGSDESVRRKGKKKKWKKRKGKKVRES